MCKWRKRNFKFLLGLFVGAFFGVYVKTNIGNSPRRDLIDDFPIELPPRNVRNVEYEKWFKGQGKTRIVHDIDVVRYGSTTDTAESAFLFERIHVTCVILVHNDNSSMETAKSASHTWAKGCNNITRIFVNVGKRKAPQIRNLSTSKWAQLCTAINNLRLNTVQRPFWALFVYEQTFVLMENLRVILAPLNHSHGHYIGHTEEFWGVQYNSAEGGYVLSYGALQHLQESWRKKSCLRDVLLPNKEDLMLGKQLRQLNIFPMDTRDTANYSTFNSFNWQQEFFPGTNYYRNAVYPRKCCSSRVVTFKGIERDKFYMYYYLLYKLNVFTRGNLGNQPIRRNIDKDSIWKRFLADRGINRDVSAEEYFKLWHDAAVDMQQHRQRIDDNYDGLK